MLGEGGLALTGASTMAHHEALHARIRELEARIEQLERALKECIDETPEYSVREKEAC